eukprot:CAMPEP_0179090768 /NCGR_PEP_ID=MMETSP0796-20121207/41427_1 /TAXON_ID=73915 /ORGANISM="Pyrodinium bahamense, Strain pbaha01" /LENGTH=608 /DNA_ID=CAMNT_0020788343 /DNA_START=62 /DNA_END=1888 /DNA_ORIENTATION=-
MGCLDWAPALYLRKWVAIDNKRLWMVQLASYIVILVLLGYILISMPEYNILVRPAIRSDTWVTLPDVAAMPQELCELSLDHYTYWPDESSPWRFSNPQCAEVTQTFCDNTSAACVHRGSIVHKAPDEVFIATSLNDEFFNASTGLRTTASYLIPGLEVLTVNHLYAYQVDLPSSWVHSIFGIAFLPSHLILAAIVGKNGNVLERTLREDGISNMTVAAALRAANVSLDDEIVGRLAEFPDNKDPTGSRRPKLRVTGLDIIVDVEYTNILPDADHNGPVAKVTLRATPAWMSRNVVDFLDSQGSTRTRTFHGVRFIAKRKGELQWFQINQVVYTLSLCLAWMQIPFFVVFYFAIFCLGTLSDVYTGFLYEDVNLQQEFNGVSSRMLELSYGFHDVHDVEELDHRVWGTTKQRLHKRMDMILRNSEELDVAERNQFTNFVFTKCASTMPSGGEAIQLEDYRSPHMNHESLLFEDVLQIVDSDKHNGNVLERLFMDDSLRAFSATAENQDTKLLGKDRKRKVTNFVEVSYDAMMEQVRKQKLLSVMESSSSLTRARYGQVVVAEQMSNLERAMDKMSETCENVQAHSDDESEEDEEAEEDEGQDQRRQDNI